MSQPHRDYFNHLAGTWAGPRHHENDLRRRLQNFSMCAGGRVLDLGAGKGILTPLLREHAGPDSPIVALDIAEKMLHLGKSRFDDARAMRLCADVNSLPFSSASFHQVVCFSTFPHFKSPIEALREIHRVLRPGGQVLIWHTCCSRKLNAFHMQLSGIVAADLLPTGEQLSQWLVDAGFTIRTCEENPDVYWLEAQR